MRSILSLLLSLSLCVTLVLGGAVGCGRKGSPRPPEELAPGAVKVVTVSGEVDALILKWEAPEFTATGEDLEDLGKFIIRRADYVKGEQPTLEDVGEVEVTGAEVSRQFTYRDTKVQPGRAYVYQVIPVNLDGIEALTATTVRTIFLGESTTANN